MEITRFDEKIIGYNDINENMVNFLNFYFFDILKILIFLFSFLCLNILRFMNYTQALKLLEGGELNGIYVLSGEEPFS